MPLHFNCEGCWLTAQHAHPHIKVTSSREDHWIEVSEQHNADMYSSHTMHIPFIQKSRVELCRQDPSLKHATSRAVLLAQFGNACRAPWGAPPKQSSVTLKTPQSEGLRETRWCRRRQTTLFHKSVKYHRVVCGSLSMTVELRTRERAVGRIKDLKEALVKSEDRVQKQKFMTRWSANRFNTFQRMHCNFQNGQSFYCLA